ncbi:aminoglycoside phosphotransferase family protein [Streptomyces sp. NPDC026673]|uniref:phosphotransferase family protein n=1 Tax=Streptomyces sp. NPDC026673 TaxID=3155724 RepID=UPI0033E357FC
MIAIAGHHHSNQVVPLGRMLAWFLRIPPDSAASVKLRIPLEVPVVVMRTWRDEAAVLAALKGVSPESGFVTPRCLVAFAGASVHRYEPGTVLSEILGPLGGDMLRDLAEVFAGTAVVGADQLPALPVGWPQDHKSSDAFLDYLVHYAEHRVHRRHRPVFGALFDGLGIPVDALARFRAKVSSRTPELQRRPYALLHTDLHRDNIVLLDAGGLFILDWELATYGDPLHDLATHLVRMRYTDDECERMTHLWEEALVRQGCSAMTAGLRTDLQAYLDFEYAQSVYADVVRAAVDLGRRPGCPRLGPSVARVQRALTRAEEAIGLTVPSYGEIEVALADWHALRHPERRRGRTFRVCAPRKRAAAR